MLQLKYRMRLASPEPRCSVVIAWSASPTLDTASSHSLLQLIASMAIQMTHLSIGLQGYPYVRPSSSFLYLSGAAFTFNDAAWQGPNQIEDLAVTSPTGEHMRYASDDIIASYDRLPGDGHPAAHQHALYMYQACMSHHRSQAKFFERRKAGSNLHPVS